jgi:RNA polymerase sigma-70 factor, ECF subfamily
MTQSTNITDGDLLRGVIAGDEEAFTALYRRHQGAVFRFALQMSGSRPVAEDVTQEVFITVIKDAGHYDDARGPLGSYLLGIARNQVLRRLRRDGPYVQLPDDDQGEGASYVAESSSNPLADLTRVEAIESVRNAILALPEHYREAVVLCDLHEMKYTEVAAVLGCAVGTVRSRLHRARGLLAEKLRPRAQPEPALSNDDNSKRCFA